MTRTPVVGFAAYSGTGKTTLLRKLIPLLKGRGLQVGLIKHAHHTFEIDTPGKDSFELRKAGADRIVVASRRRWAFIAETPERDEPRVDELIPLLDDGALDLILVEGFKDADLPKIELHRPRTGVPLLCEDDDTIIAVATDEPLGEAIGVPQLDLNDVGEIADFVCARFLPARPGEPRDA